MHFRLLAILLIASTAGRAQRFERESRVPRDPASVAAGQKLFATACSGCHGKTGEGGRGPNLSDGTLVRRSTDERLFASIQRGVPGSDMPAFPLPDAQIWQIVAYLRSLSAPALEANPPGDPAAGKQIFTGKGGCSQCHAIHGEGGLIGPDLTNAGASRTLKQLREGILDPSARIADGYRAITVTTRNGQQLEGVARNRTNYSVQMMDRKGQLHMLQAADIQSMNLHDDSLMPGDYGKKLTAEEINNLIAYLSRQAVRDAAEMRSSRRRR